MAQRYAAGRVGRMQESAIKALALVIVGDFNHLAMLREKSHIVHLS